MGEIFFFPAFGVQETSLRLFSIHKCCLCVRAIEKRDERAAQREGKTNYWTPTHEHVRTFCAEMKAAHFTGWA